MVSTKRVTGIIIHGFAVAHAGAAFALAQTVVGDEAVLTALTVAMIVAVAKANGAKWGIGDAFSYLGVMAGAYLGSRGAVFLIKWLPGIGNMANATVTFGITEMLGWAVYLILQKGRDPKSLSQDEIKEILGEAKIMQKAETVEMKRLYESMKPEHKEEFDSIMKQLKNKKLPEETREYMIGRIGAISSEYAQSDTPPTTEQ